MTFTQDYLELQDDTVDLEIFERFQFSRILRGQQIREFKTLAKIIIMSAT